MNLPDVLVSRPTLRSRNAAGYITIRSWLQEDRRDQIEAFKAEKRADSSDLVGIAAAEIVAFLGKYLPLPDAVVTSVPCGHSRRADCFGKRLAREVGNLAGLAWVQVWSDRYCSGVSHPKEFAKLPPLSWETCPDRLTVVVDDVATSGWHLEEVLNALKSRGVPAIGLAWIGGSAVEGRNHRQPAPDGPDDGDADRSLSPFGRRGGVWRVSGR